jgi:hypothetical protein
MDKKHEHRFELFNVEKFETHSRKFGYTIYTDGKSAVIRMKKPKNEGTSEPNYKDIDYEQLIGIDPGVREIYTSFIDSGRVLQTSNKDYRHKSKMTSACRKREMWYKNWNYSDFWKHVPSFKTTSTAKMKIYLEYVLPSLNVLFSLQTGFRSLNFRTYCRSKATLMSICKKITNNKKTLIGFGDYSQPQGYIKSHCTAPIKKLKNELKKYCDLIETDEYKTSKTYSECHEK